jgi:manganese oxidase
MARITSSLGSRLAVRGIMLFALIARGPLCQISAAQQVLPAPASTAIRANDNRVPAGKLAGGVLTLHLALTSGDWYPEGDSGSGMKMDALAEEGQAPQIPGPLVRVSEGTLIHVTFHNLLTATAVIHGMHQHPGDANDLIQVPAGEIREVRFLAGTPGTYQYFASAGGDINRGRPFGDDSQMHGAFIVDPPGATVSDRVFVIGAWRSEASATLSNDILVINGRSWPHTERLTYAAGEEVRWRWINASDLNHPMHMHGTYYRVDSIGDGEKDQIFSPTQQRTVVTQLLLPGTTMGVRWLPVPGRWLFHCHIVGHMAPDRTIANAHAPHETLIHTHGPEHMGGLVLGITVTGDRAKNFTAHSRTRKLSLLIRERPSVDGRPTGFGYQIEESHKLIPSEASAPGPPLVLERGRPVEITVVNQLHEPTSVHWHGIELESYYDGVAGWGARGQEVTPEIQPGHSFQVRFTPPRAGTFIYHTHLDDDVQMNGGLYGALIVLEPGAKFDSNAEKIFVVGARGGRRSGDPKAPVTLLLNGDDKPETLHLRAGQRYRMRFIDITAAGLGALSLTGTHGPVQWRGVAKDGADLPSSQAVMQDAHLAIAPGETYDFEYQPHNAQSLRLEFEQTIIQKKVAQQIEVE